jgi:formyl-CoA transferase
VAGPLEGVRVVDLTQVVLGPWATQSLADFGAEVIKVEPLEGDTTRALGLARNPGMAAMYLTLNRNKRAICLDLKQPAAMAALRRLIARADVFVHNMRPASAKGLGIDYAAIRQVKPDIVYAAARGYAAGGPDAERACYDGAVQAGIGFSQLNAGADGIATSVPSIVVDKTTALTLLSGILAALFHRSRTGQGQALEVAMYETFAWYMAVEHLNGLAFEPPVGPAGFVTLQGNRSAYPTKDGAIFVIPHTDQQWRAVFDFVGQGEVMDDARFANMDVRYANLPALIERAKQVFVLRDTDTWLGHLSRVNVPCSRVNRLDDLPRDPQLRGSGLWQELPHPSEGTIRLPRHPVQFSGTPSQAVRHLPQRLGQDTRAVLAEAGLNAAEIEALIASGAARAD